MKKIDKRSIRNISKSIANDVANRVYYEFLFARYVPEILAIEKGAIKTIETEDFKQQLINRINSNRSGRSCSGYYDQDKDNRKLMKLMKKSMKN
jgi:hypothetical protein